MASAIKRVHNLPPDLGYVTTLPDIHKTDNLGYVVFLSSLSSVSGSEKNRFWCVSGSEKNRLCVWITVGVRSDIRLPLHKYTATGQRLRRPVAWPVWSRGLYRVGHSVSCPGQPG